MYNGARERKGKERLTLAYMMLPPSDLLPVETQALAIAGNRPSPSHHQQKPLTCIPASLTQPLTHLPPPISSITLFPMASHLNLGPCMIQIQSFWYNLDHSLVTIRFGLGEFNNNNVVSAPIDLDILKSKQMLKDCVFFLLVLLLVIIVLLCLFSFSKCLFHF